MGALKRNLLDLGGHLLLEWIRDQKIAIFTLEVTTRKSVDTWVEGVMDVTRYWPVQQPYLVAHDVSNVYLIPYGRERFKEVIGINPNLTGRYAIILPEGMIGKALKVFISEKIHDVPTIEGRFFTDREEALEWLEELT